MALKTYYWNTRKISSFSYLKQRIRGKTISGFKYGNVGDIFNEDLISFLYKERPYNTREGMGKLLLVGSVASVVQPKDIICGIGWKGNDLSGVAKHISQSKVYGVRGPLTKSLFEKYDADLSDFSFEYDPGLLIKEVCNLDIKRNTEEDVVFIPHYNDVPVYKGDYPEIFKVLTVDCKPKMLAKQIMKAKVVYASSLHGIIFAHALGKQAVFVAPQSNESLFKYKDYFLSIGLEFPEPLKNIHEFNFVKDTETVLESVIGLRDFKFPKRKELADKKVIFTP